jgi:hypothetical protein
MIDKIVLFDTGSGSTGSGSTGSGSTGSGNTFTGSLDVSFTGGITMKFGTGETSISKLTSSSGTLSWHG